MLLRVGFIGAVLGGVTWASGGSALAQPDEPAIAPLTHDRHTHTHNDPHPVVHDGERFHTNRRATPLAVPAEDEAFTFAVFGDRTGGPNEGIDILAQAVADVNLLEPDLVMTVGDMIDGYNQTPGWLEQMNQYKEVMNHLLCPWFPVAGNHDVYWRGDDRPVGEHEASYERNFGPLWYAFDHKGSRFIVLYTDEGNLETGEKSFRDVENQRMSPEQLGWLKQTLADAKDADHIFLFMHHPRWTGGYYGNTWDEVHSLLVEAGNVRAVFGGHIHRMRYDPKDGIDYITLATVGGVQRGTSPAAGWLHQFHFVTVRDGQVALASVPVGEVLDVREITGEVSQMVEALSDMTPDFETPLIVADDGATDHAMRVTLANPVDAEVE
ncbi:MAG: metallophosphoesterase, partial [Planctomycetota bacterium]